MKQLLQLTLTPRSLAFLVITGVFVALFITPPGAISSLDVIAYVSAFDLFSHGGNPYDAHELFLKQREWFVQRDFPVSMWNPPIFFFYFAPIISLPPTIAPEVARSFSFICAVILANFGWRMADRQVRPIPLPTSPHGRGTCSELCPATPQFDSAFRQPARKGGPEM
jgi:hypothetical protein